MRMFSPFEAVYGHDRTFVKRMTTDEYLREIDAEERDLRGEQRQLPSEQATPSQYELRRTALSSCDPRVAFSSKYPTYDRLGRELCVLYQMQDNAVEQELRRLRRDGEAGRRSGVRLSAELQLDSAASRITGVSVSTRTTAKKSTAGARASDDGVDVTVSSLTHVSSSAPSRVASARPSEFSIYRDSAKGPLALLRAHDGAGRAPQSAPNPAGSIAAHQQQPFFGGRAGGREHYSEPPPSMEKENVMPGTGLRLKKLVECDRDGEMGGNRFSRLARRASSCDCNRSAPKRLRSLSHIGASPRLSRVRFADDVIAPSAEEAAAHETSDQAIVRGSEGNSISSASLPPLPHQQQQQQRVNPAGGLLVDASTDAPAPGQEMCNVSTATTLDPMRLTVVRESVAARITKQLFRTTVGANSRGTTTLTHANPIPSTAYGLTAATIPASKVAPQMEASLVDAAAAYGTFVASTTAPTPELRCGGVVQLGDRWFQLVSFFLAAEVYEAVEINPPAVAETSCTADSTAPTEGCPPGNEVAGATPETTDAEEQKEKKDTEKSEAAEATEETPLPQWLPRAANAAPGQHLLYRWRRRHAVRGGDEARRAALGLSHCAGEVSVTGYTFRDGGGLTLLRLPEGFQAAPLSGLPLSTAAYSTVLKMVLRMLSAMVTRRTVHGNLTSLGELLLAFPPSSTGLPIIIPVHWERAVDFSVFADRNAGRTLPYDSEDGSERPLLTLAKDLSTVLQCFLEHKQAAELSSEQYLPLQKLIVMASEPTQVANYLVQISNLTGTLQTSLPSLRQAYDAAVAFYRS